jgi:hypothetical protein
MNAKVKMLFVFVLVALIATACVGIPSAQENAAAVATVMAPVNTQLIEAWQNMPRPATADELAAKIPQPAAPASAKDIANEVISAMPQPEAQPPAAIDTTALSQAIIDGLKPSIDALVPIVAAATPTAGPIDLPNMASLQACLKTTAATVDGLVCDEWRMPKADEVARCEGIDNYSSDGVLIDCKALRDKQAKLAPVYEQLGLISGSANAVPAPAATQAPDAKATPQAPNTAATEQPQANGTTSDQALAISAEQGPDGMAIETVQEGNWEVTYYQGVTDQMRGWFYRLRNPSPELWPVFPNQPNPAITDNNLWRVVYDKDGNPQTPDGLYYGLDESVFMQQNEFGQFPVQARGYRLITGDYIIPGIDECQAETAQAGCAYAQFNVGEVTADMRGWVRQGFTVEGRYFNGDALEIGMWGLSSATSASMLNMLVYADYPTGKVLDIPSFTNAGSNCSVPFACERVRFTITITSGNQLLVKATVYVTNPTK